ncbi:MAG: PDZ domain-containing protein [Pyrinomonadaceae bacterium]|nr:PDZ domain-containing protein [Pyrinomonadaceae bacterium]
MTTRSVFSLLISLFFVASVVLAQQTPPAPVAPPAPPAPGEPFNQFSLFIDGGSFLGVYAEDINKENMGRYGLREARGVGITSIVKDSPAEKAGLKKDDVILRFDGENVTSARKLTRLVSEVAPDQTVRIAISRGGSEQEVAVTIGKRENSMDAMNNFQGLKGLGKWEGLEGLEGFGTPGAKVWKWEGPDSDNDGFAFAFGNNRRIGVSTTHLTKQLAEFFGVADGKGVLVTSVGDDSPAAKAGIKAGDVITAVDGEKLESAGDLTRALGKKKEGDVTLTIVRDKQQRSITVTPKAATSPTIGPPGTGPQTGRRVIIPRINLPTIPPINIMIPGINLPTSPEINVNIDGLPRRRGKTISVSQPI